MLSYVKFDPKLPFSVLENAFRGLDLLLLCSLLISALGSSHYSKIIFSEGPKRKYCILSKLFYPTICSGQIVFTPSTAS